MHYHFGLSLIDPLGSTVATRKLMVPMNTGLLTDLMGREGLTRDQAIAQYAAHLRTNLIGALNHTHGIVAVQELAAHAGIDTPCGANPDRGR